MKETKHYGVFTAISMIVGISVGSGIFFKAEDILIDTGGSVGLSVLVFCIAALCVIFGSVTLSELASRTTKRGGAVAYFEEFVSSKAASAMGWFQAWVYFPTITVVVSWVSGIYTIQFLGLTDTLERQVLIGFLYLSFFFGMNYFSYKFGGYFQNIVTFIKLLPLLGIGLLGIIWTSPSPGLPEGAGAVVTGNVGWGWLAALTPTAFAFDGWIVSTTIAPEVKNSRRNVPIALSVGPLIVLIVYLAYFLGMVSILGEDYILAAGDGAVSQMGNVIFGSMGEQILVFFVLLAILGVVNGVTLGYIRLPQALAAKNMMPNSKKLSHLNKEGQLSSGSAFVAYAVSVGWMFIHYITQRLELLGNGDISEIAIVFSYLAYIILYVRVIKLKKEGIIENRISGYVLPILAIIGSLVILVGGIFSNPFYTPFFIFISFIFCIAGYLYLQKKEKSQ